MSIWVTTKKCFQCGQEIEIKSFRKNPGKHVLGKGYLCQACLDAQKGEGAVAQTENTETEKPDDKVSE